MRRTVGLWNFLLLGTVAFGGRKPDEPWLPGCPSIATYRPAQYDTETSGPHCFCDRLNDTSGLIVTCVTGATFTDLRAVLNTTIAANESLDAVYLNALTFDGTPLPDYLFKGVRVKEIQIADCLAPDTTEGTIEFSNRTFEGLVGGVEKLGIFRCFFNHSFTNFLAAIPSVHILEYNNDNILVIPPGAFKSAKGLKVLNVVLSYLENIRKGGFDGLEQLESLNLGSRNHLNLTLTQANELKKLVNLRYLNLYQNDIHDIPFGLFRPMTKLERLILVFNFIGNLTEDMFLGLSSLKNLDLRVNLISDLEPGCFNGLGQMESLQLGGNYLNHFVSDVWAGLPSLQSLDLSSQEFERLQERAFGHLPNLTKLDLSQNPRLNLDGGMLDGLDSLEDLNLGYTNVSRVGSGFLKHVPELKVLSLTGSNLSSVDKDGFKGANLTTLLLNETRLTGLSKNVFTPIERSLELLDLAGNRWSCDDRLKWLVEWIKSKNGSVSAAGQPLVINNSSQTICWRPLALRNRTLASLDPTKLGPLPIENDTDDQVEITTTTEAEGLFDFLIDKTTTGKTTTTVYWADLSLPHVAVTDRSATDAVDKASLIVGVVVGFVLLATVIVLAVVTLQLMRRAKLAQQSEDGNGTQSLTKGHNNHFAADGHVNHAEVVDDRMETAVDSNHRDVGQSPVVRYVVHNRAKWLEAQPEGCVPDHIYVSPTEVAVRDSTTPELPSGRKFLVRIDENGDEQMTEISGMV